MTYHLFDADSGEDLGPATQAQVDASDIADNDEGMILIDADGQVVVEGSARYRVLERYGAMEANDGRVRKVIAQRVWGD